MLELESDDRWTKFVYLHPHLLEFVDFDFRKVRENKQFADINTYCKSYTVKDNNRGKGLMFVGDYTSKTRMFALYVLRRIMKRHFMHDNGIVAFDYANINDCITNVFDSPTENFYSTSVLLLIDSVDLESILDNKHQTKAFHAFLKYRYDTFRPTFMVVNNAITALPKSLSTLFEEIFGSNRILP